MSLQNFLLSNIALKFSLALVSTVICNYSTLLRCVAGDGLMDKSRKFLAVSFIVVVDVIVQ